MTTFVPSNLLNPQDRRLIAMACVVQCVVVAMPALWSVYYVPLISGLLLSAGAMVFSVKRCLVVILVSTVALPTPLLEFLRIPFGFKLTEVLLIVTFLFLTIDIVFVRNLRLTRTRGDTLVLLFILLTLLSALVGIYYGNDVKGSIVRNLRYPLYYLAFFIATQALDPRDGARLVAPLLILSGLAVGMQYILEFLGAIDLSMGERFFRVVRRQGIVLPIALLLIANCFIHSPKRFGRLLLVLAFLPIGLAFALTVGRGMWVAFAVGLIATLWLRHRGLPVRQRRAWRAVVFATVVFSTLVGSVLLFQRVTGAAITAHAVERSRTFVDYTRDVQVLGRLMGYSEALKEISERPIVGSGQGKTLDFYSFNPDNSQFETWNAWTVDSLFLTLWLKMGIVGLIVFVLLCVRLLLDALRQFNVAIDPDTRFFSAGTFSVLVAMMVLGIADGSMINGRFAIVFAILFGAMVRTNVAPPNRISDEIAG